MAEVELQPSAGLETPSARGGKFRRTLPGSLACACRFGGIPRFSDSFGGCGIRLGYARVLRFQPSLKRLEPSREFSQFATQFGGFGFGRRAIRRGLSGCQ